MAVKRIAAVPFAPPAPRHRARTDKKKRGKHQRSLGQKWDQMETRAKAMELRKGGLTYRDIAHALGVTVHTAHDYVQAELLELREKTQLDAESVRDMELERCDTMLSGLWDKVKKGDPQATNSAIRVLERRAHYLGLDAPAKSEFIGAFAGLTPETVAKLSTEELQGRVKALMSRTLQLAGRSALPEGTEEPDEGDNGA